MKNKTLVREKHRLENKNTLNTSIIKLSLISLSLSSSFSLPLQSSASQVVQKNPNQQKLAQKICKILKEYQLTCDIDHSSVDPTKSVEMVPIGCEDLERQILALISKNLPIKMRMVGFPFKSTNQANKVISDMPDMAERYSLEYLHSLLKRINQVYSAGAHLTIISDGCAFSDILGITDAQVFNYEQALKQLLEDLPHISVITSKDLITPEANSLKALREAILHYSLSDSEFDEKIKNDSKLKDDLGVLIKRIETELDCPNGQELLRTHGQNIDTVSKLVLQRSLGFGLFIKEKYGPQAVISVSVHYQPNVGKKIGIKLSPTSFITPWHGVLVVEKDGTSQIIHKQDIDFSAYRQTGKFVNRFWCPFYQAN